MATTKLILSKGDRFGMLEVVKEANPFYDRQRRRMVECICDCGRTVVLRLSVMYRKSNTKSCGCLRNEMAKGINISHGLSSHPLYSVWSNMKNRCYNKNCGHYHNYGGRGVYMCQEWRQEFKSFHDWAIKNGWRKGLFVDKDIKVEGNIVYSPDTCCLVTQKQNNNATRVNIQVELDGKSLSLGNACQLLGLNKRLIYARMRVLNYSFEDAINKEIWKK